MSNYSDQMNDIKAIYDFHKKCGFFDLPKQKICKHPQHNPPQHLYIPQGKGYRHVCPACGATVDLIPPQISF